MYAAAAESLCVRAKGTIPSMPERKAILQLLKEHPAIEKEATLPDEDEVLSRLKEHAPYSLENESSSPREKNIKQLVPDIQPEPVTA